MILSQRTFKLSFFGFYSFCRSDWVFSATSSAKSLIQSSALFTLPLTPSSEFFISDWSFFMCSISIFMFPIFLLMFSLSCLFSPKVHYASLLITSVLNSASGVLLVFILFSFFSWSFVLFFHLEHVSLSPHFGCLRLLL